ncbi:MAG: oxidoreductase [Candidatus Doudnabacteria bacterium]|nr:oxidoreductase [Candidatus Doudnabacteria bacterium]
MFKLIDKIIDRITMYRLVLYYLIGLLLAAVALSALAILPYAPIAIIYSSLILVVICWISNKVLGSLFKVSINIESSLITALILALIISPPESGQYLSVLPFYFLAGIVAMASKFLINIGKKHIFNPAALAVAVTGIAIGASASWWVGTASLLPFVLIGGILMLRKLRQFDLAVAFLIAVILTTITIGSVNGHIVTSLLKAFSSSPLLFFVFVMLTEPLTMPPNRDGRIAYGVLVGMLFSPLVHFGQTYFSPELALLVGNVFAYLVSPKGRHVFVIKEVREASTGVFDFVMETEKKFKFKAGQYMEWTLGHNKPDSRGNRRYFTLASSPTESEVLLGVKFYENSSSFKKEMLNLKPGDVITAGQLAGEFTLPNNKEDKLAFIAGGIGVTPFRSMIKYLVDKNEKRDLKMLYSNRRIEEVAYWELFNQAYQQLGFSTIYTLTDLDRIPEEWRGSRGFINAAMISKEIPDFKERKFYISGSHQMVSAIKEELSQIGVSYKNIKTDFFPGLV